MNRKRMKLFRMKFSMAGMVSILICVASLLILVAAFWIAFRTYGHGGGNIAALGFLALFFNIIGVVIPVYDMHRRGSEESFPVLSKIAVALNVLTIGGILAIYIWGLTL
ncbi:MAG: hypothetical protein HFI68_12140 [Lachnospiraceae bacterium]|nr:hypothetical protein [Lachnospiraceae bacterium]